jgi:aspartate/methionine/tyrosine aminotransferase
LQACRIVCISAPGQAAVKLALLAGEQILQARKLQKGDYIMNFKRFLRKLNVVNHRALID